MSRRTAIDFTVFYWPDMAEGGSCDLCGGDTRESACWARVGPSAPPEDCPIHACLPCLRKVVAVMELHAADGAHGEWDEHTALPEARGFYDKVDEDEDEDAP